MRMVSSSRRSSVTIASAISVVLAGVGWRGQARAADFEPPPAPTWRATALLGTTAVSANNVLPAPMAIGGGALVERGWIGIEGAVHVDAATLCDHGTAGDSSCGLLWIFDLAPRATLAPRGSWSPYLAARFQLTSSEPHGVVPAAGPRVGLRYRGTRLGWYLEGGPSFVSSREREIGGFTSSGRAWFPQISTGMTFAVR
jgi:hypothetical protein